MTGVQTCALPIYVAGSFVADDVVDKDPDDGDEPGGGGGEAPDPAA